MPKTKKPKLKEETQKTYFLRNIIFCPKCRSTNIIKKLMPEAIPNLGALSQTNVCQDCGFQDRIFPEIDENDKNILNKLQKIFKKKNNKK